MKKLGVFSLVAVLVGGLFFAKEKIFTGERNYKKISREFIRRVKKGLYGGQ